MSAAPAGQLILCHLGELTLRNSHVTAPSVADARFARQHLLPWIGRRLTGRSSGDGLRRPTVHITRGVQLHLLELLGIEVTRTRWPQT